MKLKQLTFILSLCFVFTAFSQTDENSREEVRKLIVQNELTQIINAKTKINQKDSGVFVEINITDLDGYSGSLAISTDGKEEQIITAPGMFTSGDYFGSNFSLVGDDLIVSAPGAHTIYWYKKTKGKFKLISKLKNQAFDIQKTHIYQIQQNKNFIVLQVNECDSFMRGRCLISFVIVKKDNNKLQLNEILPFPETNLISFILKDNNDFIYARPMNGEDEGAMLTTINLADKNQKKIVTPLQEFFTSKIEQFDVINIYQSNTSLILELKSSIKSNFQLLRNRDEDYNLKGHIEIVEYRENQNQYKLINKLLLNTLKFPKIALVKDFSNNRLLIQVIEKRFQNRECVKLLETLLPAGDYLFSFENINHLNYPEEKLFYYKHLKNFYRQLREKSERSQEFYKAYLALVLLKSTPLNILKETISVFENKFNQLYPLEMINRPLTTDTQDYLKSVLVSALENSSMLGQKKIEIATLIAKLKASSPIESFNRLQEEQALLTYLMQNEPTAPIAMVILELQKLMTNQ